MNRVSMPRSVLLKFIGGLTHSPPRFKQSHFVATELALYPVDQVVCSKSQRYILPESRVVSKIEIMNMTKKTTICRRMIYGKAFKSDRTATLRPCYR